MAHHSEFMIVRGVMRDRTWVETHMVCRKCHAPVGRPYIHHITGEIDHDGMTCDGDDRHEILDEGDVMPRALLDWLEGVAQVKSLTVRANYGLSPVTAAEAHTSLYQQDDPFNV